jgi:sugar phosphate isomerase/epimerase
MLYTIGEPFEKMVEEIPRTGATYVEIVDDGAHVLGEKRVLTLNSVRDSYDVEYTVHAPFTGINISLQNGELLNATLRRLKESIVNSAGLNCRLWVFHSGMKAGVSMFYPGMDWSRNLESVRLLSEFADEHGVKTAIENVMEPFVLTGVAEFKRFYSELNGDVGLALDTGHANLTGEVEAFLTELSDKLVHVHAQDNLGKVDQHLGIGYGSINWQNFAELLKKTSFDGVVVLESVEHIEESMRKLKKLLL